jgi:hypothetical protein
VAVVIAAAERHAIERAGAEALQVALVITACVVAVAVATVAVVVTLRLRQLAGVMRQNTAARGALTEAATAAAITMRGAAEARTIPGAVERPAITAAPAWPHTAWSAAPSEAEVRH